MSNQSNQSDDVVLLLLKVFIVWPIKLFLFVLGFFAILIIGLLFFAPPTSWGKDIRSWGNKLYGRKE